MSRQSRANSMGTLFLQATYRGVRIILIGVFILAAALPAGAQMLLSKPSSSAADELQNTQKALDKARKKAKKLEVKAVGLEQDIIRIREELVTTAKVIQYHELRAAEIKYRIEKLNASQIRISSTFERRRRQLGNVLAALQRIAKNPPESLWAQPITPADIVRSAIVLRATLERLEEEAVSYRKDLDVLIAARAEANKRRQEFNKEMSKLNEQRLRLQLLHRRKTRLRQRMVVETDRASRQAMSLAKQAASLRELVKRLDAHRGQREMFKYSPVARQSQKASKVIKTSRSPHSAEEKRQKFSGENPPFGFSGQPFDSRKGLVPYPVVGRVAVRYGQPISKGQTHKGITLETGKAAQVIAPYEGKVAFSGPFRSYGELLIIEHNGGYHTLLAGMARIDVAVGQWVLTGEPIAVMEREGAHKPVLYLEIRRNSQPINPLPWLALHKGKISG